MSRNSGTDGTADWLMSTIKRHPEGFLLMAAGCAVMLRSGGSSGRGASRSSGNHRQSDGGNDYQDQYRSGSGAGANARSSSGGVSDTIAQGAQSAARYASDMKDRVADTAGSVADTASSYASSLADYAGEAGRSMSDQSGRLVRQARSTMEDTVERVLSTQPLAVALVGLAAGAAVAAAFPTTDIEKRALGDAGESLTDAAGQVGAQFKQAATKAGQSLMDAAEQHGLNKDGLKEVAENVAGAFSGVLSGEQSKSGGQSQGSRSQGSGMQGGSGSQGQSKPGGQSQGSYGSSRSSGSSGTSGSSGSQRQSNAPHSTTSQPAGSSSSSSAGSYGNGGRTDRT